MTAGKPAQGAPYQPSAHAAENEQLFGMYLGLVTHTRPQDLWIKISIPQILGDQDSNWARPIGFNSVGAALPATAATGDPAPPLLWGGFNDWGFTGQPLGWSGSEIGSGPPAGSLVVVVFLGGDRNRPGYLLTSQHVG